MSGPGGLASESLTVFVDTVGAPWSRGFSGRRMLLRALFPMSVFRFEVCKALDSLPPERARLWHLQPDVGEVLVDLSGTAAENRIVNGSRLLLEVRQALAVMAMAIATTHVSHAGGRARRHVDHERRQAGGADVAAAAPPRGAPSRPARA